MDSRGSTPRTPKPFLRKGSRQEPTALRRIQKAKESGSTPASPESTPDENKVDNNVKCKQNNGEAWRPNKRYEQIDDYDSSLSQSALMDVTPDIMLRRKQQQLEVDEFAALERQLDEDESLGYVISNSFGGYEQQQLRSSSQSLPVGASVASMFVDESFEPSYTATVESDSDMYAGYDYENFEDYISPPDSAKRVPAAVVRDAPSSNSPAQTKAAGDTEDEEEANRPPQFYAHNVPSPQQLYLSSDEDEDGRPGSPQPFDAFNCHDSSLNRPGSTGMNNSITLSRQSHQSLTWGAVTRGVASGSPQSPSTPSQARYMKPQCEGAWDIPFSQVGSSTSPSAVQSPSPSVRPINSMHNSPTYTHERVSVQQTESVFSEVEDFDQEFSETESDIRSLTQSGPLPSSSSRPGTVVRSRPKIGAPSVFIIFYMHSATYSTLSNLLSATGRKIRQPPRSKELSNRQQPSPQQIPAVDLTDKAKALEIEL